MTSSDTAKPRRITIPVAASLTLLTVFFALANVPGQPIVGPIIYHDGKYGPHFECGTESVNHGWPFDYLRHGGVYPEMNRGPSPWRIGDEVEFFPWALAANILLFVVCVYCCGNLLLRAFDRKKLRFRTSHLLTLMLGICLALGFATSRYQLHQAQANPLQKNEGISAADWQPFGPYWLRELTGDTWWEWGDHLVGVSVEHSDMLADFPGKSHVKRLQIMTVHCQRMPPLDEWKNLRAVDMFKLSYDTSDFVRDDEPDLWPCLRSMARCDSLQGLNLYDAGLTNRDLAEVAKFRRLSVLELSANSSITDEGLTHLEAVESLEYIGLAGTRVTKPGVERLRAALPKCDVQ